MPPELTYVVAGASVIALIANVYKKTWCFYIWLCTNFIWTVHNYHIGEYAQAASFAIYGVLTFWGIVQWSKEDKEDKE